MSDDELHERSIETVDLSDKAERDRQGRYAIRFVINTLGRDWVERELKDSSESDYLMLGDEFADDGPETAVQDAVRTHRLFALAGELESAQHVPGFADLLVEMRTRSLYDAVAEMRAVRLMLNVLRDVEFVKPTGHRGSSFDVVMTLDRTRVPVEIKTKRPAPVADYRPTALTNSLSDRPQTDPAKRSRHCVSAGAPPVGSRPSSPRQRSRHNLQVVD